MKVVLLFLLSFFTTGCISLSGVQTADTMKKGKTSGYMAAWGTRYMAKAEEEEGLSTSGSDDRGAALVAGARYGLANDFELQAGTGGGATNAGIKFRYLNGASLSASVGALVNYARIQDGSGDEFDSSQTTLGAQLPLYFSMDFSRGFSLYAIPRIAYANSKSSDEEVGTTSVAQGGSIGMIVGGDVGFVAEVGAFHVDGSDNEEKATSIQAIAGIVFGRDGVDR